MARLMSLISIAVLITMLLQTRQPNVFAANLHKRSFASLGCMGDYDKSKFARLDRVCEECYLMFREPDIHNMCRADCFTNEVFTRCVDALLLGADHPKLQAYVSDLSVGRK